ncbi:MAG: AAA family ATPase [Thermoguttaceae bacterium]
MKRLKKNTSSENSSDLLRIEKLQIENYKGIESLEIVFPPKSPVGMLADICVIGSKNGAGKTSILECCCILLAATTQNERRFVTGRPRRMYGLDISDLLIRSGQPKMNVRGTLSYGKQTFDVELCFERETNMFTINTGSEELSTQLIQTKSVDRDDFDFDDLFMEMAGIRNNPVINDRFLFFHSYRKIREGNPEAAMMLGNDISRSRFPGPRFRGEESPMSIFKTVLLRAMMGRAKLFEDIHSDGGDPNEIINKLNELVVTYARVKITKLRPGEDNTFDFRVEPVSGGETFTFDGLSSGQKEIISTLFLIWYSTRKTPCVVLIDEPELHLNTEWHREFINSLIKLAPNNQYIIATHAEEIMDSVEPDYRMLLTKDEVAK